MEPFYLLNKKIQKVIHEMKWENFIFNATL